jgi:selenocysteine lyase/cysteine desulfurase
MRNGLVAVSLMVGTVTAAQQPANPRQQPGATITMFAPEQHDLYDGHYVLSATRIYMVGRLNRFGTSEAIRASASVYSTLQDIDRLADALHEIGSDGRPRL